MSPPGNVDSCPAVATRARHLLIRASAGSGKTYQLVIRYLRRLLDGVPAERILASTFTRKSAGEILERILGRLAQVAHDPEELERLAAQLGEPGLDRAACLRLLKSLTRELHRLRIGTLDSFFGRLAKSYTLELGLPPGWEIIEELEDTALRSRAIATILQDGTVKDLRKLTNLLSKGDAGRSVSRQLHETVASYYGIFQQTDKAAWHSFPELFPLSSETLSLTIEELRSVELPSHKKIQQQREKDLDAVHRGDWGTFVSAGIAAALIAGKTTYYGKTIEGPAATVYQKLSEHARAIVIQERADRTAAAYELLSKFDAVYWQLKRETRRLRFEDVTLALERAFAEEPVQPMMYRLDSDVAHLLLDEFQDTSRSQWAVLRPFAERITGEQEGTSFFCVGDVKQAIYGWRGGVAEIFDAVDEQLSDVTPAVLVESRRSSQVIINTVNELFTGLSRHENLQDDEPAVRRWCDRFDEHRTALEIPGHVTVETPAESDALDAETPSEKVLPAAVRLVKTIADEAPEAEVAVLVRRNASIAPVIHGLQVLGIDASEEGGNPLTDSAGVQLLLSLTTLADHPGDTAARFHVAMSPLGAVLEFTSFEDDGAAARLASAVRRQLIDDGYGPTFERWTRSLFPHVSVRDRGRLGQLVELAYRYEVQGTLRPARFVQFVEETKVDAPSPAKVRVMSIHQAKGLEFDVVVLPLVEKDLVARTPKYVAAGRSPTARPDLVFDYPNKGIRPVLPENFRKACTAARAAQVTEELCSLYVAVTRSVHALHVIVPACDKSGRRLPKNTAGLVRAALCDGEPAPAGQRLVERGDPRWAAHRGLPSTAETAGEGSTEPEPSPRLTVKLAEMAGGRSRGLRRVAPSQAETAARVRLSQRVKSPQAAALELGTLIHAWFEQIEWIEDGLPDEDLLRGIAQRMGHPPTQAQRSLDGFREMLSRPAVAEMLSKESYLSLTHPPLPPLVRDELSSAAFELEVDRERSVVARIEGDLLTGAIDRLVLLRQGGAVLAADVIDFKTDAVGPRGAAALPRTAHYRRQMDSYVAAIGRIYRLPVQRITARLAFVESGEIVSIAGDSPV